MTDSLPQDEERYDALKLSNQLCFPLYACSKEIVRRYAPILKPLDLTYTQYIVMLALWEKKSLRLKELGEMLFLDSGTLTPLVNRLSEKGYLKKFRSEEDARDLVVKVTDKGWKIREKAVDIPSQMGSCIDLSEEDGVALYQLLYKLIRQF